MTTDQDVTAPTDETAFVEELRDWFASHLVGDFKKAGGVGGIADDSHWELRSEWEKELARDRWLNMSWPVEFGGRAADPVFDLLFQIEHAAAGAPYWVGSQGRDLFGPTLLTYGTDEQKARFLPRITAVEEFWGQGFSEPGSGSDLASLRTSARREGDTWVLNGQKIWMTFGNRADWLYVLCRTNPDAPRHRGISMIMVDRHQVGVDVRTIRNMAGGAEFCEVFFDDAVTPASMVVGEVDQGWNVVMATLGNERGGTTVLPFLASFQQQIDGLLTYVRAEQAQLSPALLVRVVKAWEDYRVLRLHADRLLGTVLAGGHPGSESSLLKLFWGTWHRSFGELLVDVLDADALGGGRWAPLAEAHERVFLNSRAETIYGGTVEIQRNIIAERVLGLPR